MAKHKLKSKSKPTPKAPSNDNRDLIGIVGGIGGHPRQFTSEESSACFGPNGRYNPAMAAMIYRGMMSEADEYYG